MFQRTVLAIVFLGFGVIPSVALASMLYITPESGTYGIGDTFVAELRLNTEGECMNAAEVTLVYPKNTLKAVDFSRGDSIFSLWVQEPKIDVDTGTVTLSGGVPGGYCGRIQGDPSLSNIIGKVIFTVISADDTSASLRFGNSTKLYANDGLGTTIIPTLKPASFMLVHDRQIDGNPWVDAVKSDTTPPDPFIIQVESTRGVFGGRYYIVFSTLDKQSGLDHFDIFEHGGWNVVTSPHEIQSPSLLADLRIRAVDKAGNVRMGDFVATSVPQLQTEGDYTTLYICFALLIFAVIAKAYLDRRKKEVPADSA